MAILFLSLAEVLEIHQDQIARYGGEPGTRDLNLLKSAVAMPAVTFDGHYLHDSIFEMAAAYLYHLVQTPPFIDGNKRVGAVAAVIFLTINGYHFHAPTGVLADFVVATASGNRSKAEGALFFRKNCAAGS